MGIDKDLIWFLLWIPITVIDKELIWLSITVTDKELIRK
jgi:hypothetical protein